MSYQVDSDTPMPRLSVSVLLVGFGLCVCNAFSPSFSPNNNGNRHSSSRVVMKAKEELDPVEKIFKFLFGEKEEKPLGFTRYNQTTSPENFPAVIDRYPRIESELVRFVILNAYLRFLSFPASA